MADTNVFSTPLQSGIGKFMRKWGTSTSSTVVEPYITGYHFIKFQKMPNFPNSESSLISADLAAQILEASCMAVTLPGATMNKAEVIGLGNIKYGAPANADLDNTFTIRFLETKGVPVIKVLKQWFNLIRSTTVGVSLLEGNDYNKANYSATVYYWTTLPDGKTLQFYSCLAGVFPTKLPSDSYGHDLSTYDKLEIDAEFHVDYVFSMESWVSGNITSIINGYNPEFNSSNTFWVL